MERISSWLQDWSARGSPGGAQFARYLFVGVINTFVCIAVMLVLKVLGSGYPVYTAAGYAAGIACSYLLNALITFQVNPRSYRAFAIFVAVNLSVLGAASAIQVLLIEGIGLAETIGVACGIVSFTVISYFADRSLVFKNGRT